MSPMDIIRAWKSEEVRSSLTVAQRASLPANPAGLIELTEAQLEIVAGGAVKSKAGSGCGGGGGTGSGTGGNCSKVACCQKKAPPKALRRRGR